MLLDVLSENTCSTLVVTVDNLEEASFIMSCQVLVHDDRATLLIWADDLPEQTALLVLLQIFTLDDGIATFFEETLSFVRAVKFLETTLNI